MLLIVGSIVTLVKAFGGKYQDSIKKYCMQSVNYDETMRRVEQFYNTSPLVNGFRVSSDYVLVSSDIKTLFWEGKDLLWAYTDATTHYTYFIKTGTSYAVTLRSRDGEARTFQMKSEELAQEVLQYIHAQLPFVIIGYSKELESLYCNNREEMIAESENIRREWCMNAEENPLEQ